ncbi:quinon protein alcohol dehydrogenase-like superfamily [Rhizoctonia solani]|nr:quinon protein alcohol dehydrogenase-like superfamily [Rhizoctonia solani]
MFHSLEGHTDAVVSVAISPDNKYIVSGSWDCTVRVWDKQTSQMLFGPFQNKTTEARSVAISPDSSYISAGFGDGTIQVWDANTGLAVSKPFKEHLGAIKMLAYSSDGTRMVSFSIFDGSLCLFDAQRTTIALNNLPGHTKPIITLSISPNGKCIVSGSQDTTLYVWSLITGQPLLGPLTEHTETVRYVRFSADGNRILSCASDRSLRQWDVETGSPLKVDSPIVDTSVPVMPFYRLEGFDLAAYSPDNSCIATISPSASICVWNSSSGKVIQGPIRARTEGRSLEFSSDGTALLTGLRDGTVCIWDVQTGHLIFGTQPQEDLSVSAFAFSSDGLHYAMAQGYPYSVIYQKNAWTGEQIHRPFKNHGTMVISVGFSPDGTRIVSGSEDRTIHIWDLRMGTSISGPLRGHTERITSVAYSPDSIYVVSTSNDATIRIWDTREKLDKCPFNEWTLSEDGWVINAQAQQLLWVPPDLRPSLMSPRNTALLSHNGYVRLNFEGALIGETWASCWLGPR